jgi:serine/threonine-protein kinase
VPSRARALRAAAVGTAVVLLVALAAAFALRSADDGVTVAPSAVGRFTIPLIEGEALPTGQSPLAVSPDGQFVAFDTARSGSRRLYLRAIAEREPRLVSENSFGNPFFSPDSQWLGYFADGQLKKVSVRGGPSIALANAPSGRGASWGEDGFIVFAATSRSAGLSRVSS